MSMLDEQGTMRSDSGLTVLPFNQPDMLPGSTSVPINTLQSEPMSPH